MATTSSSVAFTKGEGDFPERLICPVCFRLPEKEVFQCRDGHVLCSECYNRNTKCRQCRGSLVKHQPIRNRFFETELEQIAKVDCPFKSKGCVQKVRKDLLEQHQHSCCFNYEKFGSPFSLCEAMNLSCNFRFNQGNLKEFVVHFIIAHGAKMTKSREFRMELCNILGGSSSGSVVDSAGYALEFFTPIITDLEEEECYILTIPMLNTSLDLFQIVSYYLPCFNSEKTLVNPFKMKYSVSKSAGAEYTGAGWSFVAVLIDDPTNLMESKDASLTTTRSGCLQTSQLKSYITSGNSLLVDCKILLFLEGNAVKNNISVRPLVIFKCHNISQILKKTETKTVKRARLTDFKREDRADAYLWTLEFALHNSTPSAFEIIDMILDSVAHKEKGYLSAQFGPDNFKWILYKAMFMVVQHGSVEALKLMISINGFDWDVVGYEGFTLLHLTMSDCNLVRGLEKAQLLQNKIDVKALDDNGWSLAHHAAYRSNDHAMAFVCQLGLDLNAKDKHGDTPFHLALEVVKQHGAHMTAKKVEVILKHGADPDVRNGNGDTPLDFALSEWNKLDLWERVKELFHTHYKEKKKVATEKRNDQRSKNTRFWIGDLD